VGGRDGRDERGGREVRDNAASRLERWVPGEMPRKPWPKKELIGELEALLYIAPIPCSISLTSYAAAAASRAPARRGLSGYRTEETLVARAS